MRIKNNKICSIRELLESYCLGKPKIHQLYMGKKVLVNNLIINFDKKMEINDLVDIDVDEINDIKPCNKPIEVLYEDDYILVVNKEANCIIHGDDDALINRVSNYFINNNINRIPRFINRIDKDTTGIVTFTKDFITQSFLDKEMFNRNINKVYLAIVMGVPKKKDTIRLKITKDRHSDKMVCAKGGDLAITHYELVKIYKGFSLVRIKLETGKTHQIRVHFSSIGHPLVGDELYGGNDIISRQALHAHMIEFNHPFLNKRIVVKSEIPSDLKSLIEN